MHSLFASSEQRLFLAGAASIAAHQIQSFVEEPEQRPIRALALVALSAVSTWFLHTSPGPTDRVKRGRIALLTGAGPTFGAFVGHLVPLVRRGEITPASETAILNLGGGAFLVVFGIALLRNRVRHV